MTILMPAKNAARYITRALASLSNQTTQDWDCQVLVDRSTSDRTYKIAVKVRSKMKNPKKVHVNISQKGGLPQVYKEIIDRAEPVDDLCGFLDSDDQLVAGAVKAMIRTYEKKPGIGCAWSQFCHTASGHAGWSKDVPPGLNMATALCTGWWGAQHFRTFRKSTYEASSYGLQLDVRYATDFNLALVLSAPEPAWKFVDSILYIYHHTPGSITRKDRPAQIKDYVRLKQRFKAWRRKHQ